MATKNQPDYKSAEIVVDAVMEWISLKWTPSMIRRELREAFPDITFKTCNWFIGAAKRKIVKLHGIDPNEYKGSQIALYETIIRNPKTKTPDIIKAAERLDKLFGLENISNIDPEQLAEKILTFKRRAAQTIGGLDNGGNKNERNGESSNEDEGTKANTDKQTHADENMDSDSTSEFMEVDKEILKELKLKE